MLSNSYILKLIILLATVLSVSHCAKVAESQSRTTIKQTVSTPYTMAAESYLSLAKNQSNKEKQNLLLMAAGRFLYEGQWQRAKRILTQLNDLTESQMNEKNILLAKIGVIEEQPRTAISKLAAVHEAEHLPAFYQIEYHEILANAYESLGRATESVTERIKLESLLADEASRSKNQRVLWLTLTKLSSAELNTLALESQEGSDEQGWMKLALISRQSSDNTAITLARIEQWQEKYPNHAANNLLPASLSEARHFLYNPPRQIALLLPLTGPLSGPGGAIRDGFLAAQATSSNFGEINVRLYDTASENVGQLYQQALTEGADYVVGPLSKTDVAVVASMNHPVPTLLLNDMTADNTTNVYRFGLSPSNEARQIAAKAAKKGYKRALIVAPSGIWGDEIVSAFIEQWRSEGGEIADRFSYAENDDLNRGIREVLRVSESQERQNQIKKLLGSKIQTTTRRRQDFDMIFLLAYPSKARQIMPLLKYYYAGNVPVYATSTVYSANANIRKDKDLDGIIFCDMPWVFTHQLENKNWPEQFNSYNRLYALGMDSYALAMQLNQLLLFPALGINDKGDVLYLNRAQQIARVPAWGKFKGGVAHLLNEHG